MALLSASSCVSEEEKLTASTTSSTVTVAPPSLAGKGLYLQLESAYSTTPTDKQLVGTCSVDLNAAVGTSASCSFSMPEGELYFSELTFSAGTADADQCKFVHFLPYYYQASSSAGYIPQHDLEALAEAADEDCSASPIPDNCFNGVAADIVDGFPTRRSAISETVSGMDVVYNTVPSAFDSNKSDNKFTANSLILQGASVGAGATQLYLASTMQNYRVYCRNEFYEIIYTINMTFDSIPGAINHWPDW